METESRMVSGPTSMVQSLGSYVESTSAMRPGRRSAAVARPFAPGPGCTTLPSSSQVHDAMLPVSYAPRMTSSVSLVVSAMKLDTAHSPEPARSPHTDATGAGGSAGTSGSDTHAPSSFAAPDDHAR